MNKYTAGVLVPYIRRCAGRPVRAVLTRATFWAMLCLCFAATVRNANAQGCGSPPNAIVAENCLTGNPSGEWDISGAGSASIQGFATDISFVRGETVRFKVRSTNATAYRLDIYRSGYYNGSGARKVATVLPSVTLPQAQPNCLTNAATGLIDCGNWAVSASWVVPANAASGVYFAKLVATAGITGSSHIMFVVRDDTGGSDLLFQTSDTTWQAYNNYGGNSLYTGSPAGRAYKVSYNRPFATRAVDGGQDGYFANEYPMVRWMEANGYNVSYTTGVDTDRRGAEILEHKAFLSVGHDEYWSGVQRTNVEIARDQGVHLAFFSGNEVFWKTRWENGIDGSGASHRTLVSYKETHAGARIDPSGVWTGTWRDPRFSPPADGGRAENALTGTMFFVNSGSQPITVSEAEGKLRFWRNTSFAQLPSGGTGVTNQGMIGYESDDAPTDSNTPAGLIRLSTTTFDVSSYLLDYGSTYGNGRSTHSLVLHRRPSGALVFGAGTIRWSWGMDGTHDIGGWGADTRMQQATVNLFADMGVQAANLRPGLVPATASADVTPPVSIISSPTAGTHFAQGVQVTVSGTAGDVGGRLAVVEVSVDGGATWTRATGTTTWTFAWSPAFTGPWTLKSRGVDDSGNFESPTAGVSVVVDSRVCPCTIWSPNALPEVANDSDTAAVELGVKFRSSESGTITGLRFYKGASNTGTHLGKLWTSSGTLLASVAYTNETAGGWQQATLNPPVAIAANTTYVASYWAPNGRYSADNAGLFQAVDSPPLRALSDGESGGNGVYRYASTGFPNATWNATNYWVDVVFMPASSDTTAPVIASVSATPASSSAVIAWTTNENSNSSVSYGTSAAALNQSAFNAAMVANHALTLNGLAPATYYYRVTSADAASNSATAPLPPATLSFTVIDNTAPIITGVTATPGSSSATINWTTDEPATTVVNYGPAPGTLNQSLSSAGLVLAHTMAIPGLTPGATYYYRVTSADAAGNTATSPTPGSFTTTVPVPPSISAVVATASAGGAAAISWTTDRLSNSRVDYGSDPNTLNQVAAGAAMVTSHSISLTGLTQGTTYYFRVTSVEVGGAGATLPNSPGAPASFLQMVTLSVWPSNPIPSAIDSGDAGPTEVGLKFRSESAGLVTGIRFYKAPANTGIHTGNLWSANGALLGSLTFADETASGWQKASFASPIPIAANTTYVVSYHAPAGHYSQNSGNFLSAGVDTPPLHALASGVDGPNGVFIGSAAGAFPTNSSNGSNYWTDVVFADTAAPLISAVSPTTTATSATITWTTSEGSTTRVDYGASPSSLNPGTLDSAIVINHSRLLSGLSTGVTYYYRVLSVDASGNSATFPAPADPPLTFVPQDSTPPVIATVAAIAAATSVTITWTTNEPSSTAVAYGLSPATLDQNASNPAQVSSHSIAVTGLTAGLTYYFRVTSADAANNSATSPNPPNAPLSFVTVVNPAPVITAVVAAPGLDGAARITWTTNEAANSSVQFGTSPDVLNQNAADAVMVTAHVVNLTGLTYGARYYFRVTSVDAGGAAATSPAVPAQPSSFVENPISLFPSNSVPAVPAETTDTAAVVLGVKFRSDVAGVITAIRFYKGAGNTGSHTARIWSGTGTSLASVTFANETATGWQQQLLTTPLAIAANTTYVVSYRAPVGRYAINDGYFANGVDRVPLHAPSNAAAGGNGVYRYGAASVFPNQTWQSSNYWVDVVFVPNP